MEQIHEEFGRQQLDDQYFEPPFDDEMDGDPFRGKPHGEEQVRIDHQERQYDEPGEYGGDDYDPDWYAY